MLVVQSSIGRPTEIPSSSFKMHSAVFMLAYIASSTSAASFKFYKTERTETDVQVFNMDPDVFDVTEIKRLREDRGNVTNCGDQSQKFLVQWSPRILNTQDAATLYWDVVAPADFTSGNGHVDVYLSEIPQSPIFSLDQEVECATIRKTVPSINCPIKKGVELKGQMTVSDLTRLPTGEYIIEIKLTNEKNVLVLCGRAELILQAS